MTETVDVRRMDSLPLFAIHNNKILCIMDECVVGVSERSKERERERVALLSHH